MISLSLIADCGRNSGDIWANFGFGEEFELTVPLRAYYFTIIVYVVSKYNMRIGNG